MQNFRSFHPLLRLLLLALFVASGLTACGSPKILSETPDSVTFVFPSNRYGTDDAKEDAEAYCRKRGLSAELISEKHCTAPCLDCALQCRATFACR